MPADEAPELSPYPHSWNLRGQFLHWGQRTYLMGILNITPDSFSDGGLFNSVRTALAQAQGLADANIDILDIGGQSTRPQALEVPLTVELERVIPVIKAIRQHLSIPISIDTTRAAVAEAAITAGADLVNDVSGGTYDLEMLSTVARLGGPHRAHALARHSSNYAAIDYLHRPHQ